MTCHRLSKGTIICFATVTEHYIRGRRVTVEWMGSDPWPIRRRDGQPWKRVPEWMWQELEQIAARRRKRNA